MYKQVSMYKLSPTRSSVTERFKCGKNIAASPHIAAVTTLGPKPNSQPLRTRASEKPIKG